MRALLVPAILLAAPLVGCATTDPVTVTSPTVQAGEPIPAQHTCDGKDTSPAIAFQDIPEGSETMALIVDDPDASDGDAYVHWLVWNVPVSGGSANLPEATAPSGAVEGTNSAGSMGYVGPCPPREDGAHTYDFKAYAADRSLSLEEGADRAQLEEALDGHILSEGRLSAIYDR